jgi:Ca-activated chloride channel family protein
VGYLLDQIRANGEKKELVDEVVALAKKYGIATPYTSYLIVPDAPVPVVNAAIPGGGAGGFRAPPGAEVPPGLATDHPAGTPVSVTQFAKQVQGKPGELAGNRGRFAEDQLRKAGEGGGKGQGKERGEDEKRALKYALEKKEAYDRGREALFRRDKDGVQTGKLGVDLSIQTNNLRNQSRLEQTAQRQVGGRNCLEIGGVWIDEDFDPKMPTLAVKAMSEAYFRLLERHPELKDVFRLGNHLLWVTPNGTALVIDTSDGKDKLSDADIDKLFVAKK